MLPGDRLVCALVEPQPVGTQFKDWPLHVTIVPWFRLIDNSEQISISLQRALAVIRPFKVKVLGQAKFGPNHERSAYLIEPVRFSEIEHKVRTYLHKKRAWLVDETTKNRQVFRPHITIQKDKGLKTAKEIFCDRLYIVEQRGLYKEIVAEVWLGRL